MQRIFVIIPAINEQDSIGKVIESIPKDITEEIIVIDNGSTDRTIETASASGATVLTESQRGYGAACLKGLDYVHGKKPDNDDIIVFLDGDYSDYPEELPDVIEPILKEQADVVIGSRILGKKKGMAEEGSLLPQAEFGNWLSTKLIKLFWRYSFTDLGPFRAIRYKSFIKMKMEDRNYGWTVEMQVKAARLKLKSIEVPVSYRKRIGESKVTGTISGSVKAGVKILWIIFIYTFKKI